MSDIRNHRDLEAWQVAMEAVLKTYDVTSAFPSTDAKRRALRTAGPSCVLLVALRLFT